MLIMTIEELGFGPSPFIQLFERSAGINTIQELTNKSEAEMIST